MFLLSFAAMMRDKTTEDIRVTLVLLLGLIELSEYESCSDIQMILEVWNGWNLFLSDFWLHCAVVTEPIRLVFGMLSVLGQVCITLEEDLGPSVLEYLPP